MFDSSPGLAKSAPIPIAEPQVPKVEITKPSGPQATISAPHFEGVPTDMIRFFVGEDFGAMNQKTVELLRGINNWSKQGLVEDTVGNRLQKIKSLESRLGAPGIHESRIDKLYNWCRLQSHIDEIRSRQSSFER